MAAEKSQASHTKSAVEGWCRLGMRKRVHSGHTEKTSREQGRTQPKDPGDKISSSVL